MLKPCSLGWGNEHGEEIAPDKDVLPTTVEEAVDQAKVGTRGFLCLVMMFRMGFGRWQTMQVPPKIFSDPLAGLSALAEALLKGALGMTIVKWLKGKNINVSGESETVQIPRPR